VEFRPLRKGSLLGFATVRLGSGLILYDDGVHRQGSRAWCSPPARPWINGDGSLVRDDATGKVKYAPVVRFATHGVRSSWSRQILAALQEQYPEVIGPDAAVV
jgi:hypothetical protein